MKCQSQFSGKKKKNTTNLSSAELAQRVVTFNYKYLEYFITGRKNLYVLTYKVLQ